MSGLTQHERGEVELCLGHRYHRLSTKEGLLLEPRLGEGRQSSASLRPEYEARVTQDGFVHRLRREGDAGNGQTGCGDRCG